MDISKTIKSIREAKKLTQKDVSDLMGIEQSNYARFEKRGDKLTIEQLKSIAKALNVSIKEILFPSDVTPVSDRETELLNREIQLLKRENKLKDEQIITVLKALEIESDALRIVKELTSGFGFYMDRKDIIGLLDMLKELQSKDDIREAAYSQMAVFKAINALSQEFIRTKPDNDNSGEPEKE